MVRRRRITDSGLRSLVVSRSRTYRGSAAKRAIAQYYKDRTTDISDYVVVWARAKAVHYGTDVRFTRLDIIARSANSRKFVYGRMSLSAAGFVGTEKLHGLFKRLDAAATKGVLKSMKSPHRLQSRSLCWKATVMPSPRMYLTMLDKAGLLCPITIGGSCRINVMNPLLTIATATEPHSYHSGPLAPPVLIGLSEPAPSTMTSKEWRRRIGKDKLVASAITEEGYPSHRGLSDINLCPNSGPAPS